MRARARGRRPAARDGDDVADARRAVAAGAAAADRPGHRGGRAPQRLRRRETPGPPPRSARSRSSRRWSTPSAAPCRWSRPAASWTAAASPPRSRSAPRASRSARASSRPSRPASPTATARRSPPRRPTAPSSRTPSRVARRAGSATGSSTPSSPPTPARSAGAPRRALMADLRRGGSAPERHRSAADAGRPGRRAGGAAAAGRGDLRGARRADERRLARLTDRPRRVRFSAPEDARSPHVGGGRRM